MIQGRGSITNPRLQCSTDEVANILAATLVASAVAFHVGHYHCADTNPMIFCRAVRSRRPASPYGQTHIKAFLRRGPRVPQQPIALTPRAK
jgi:hypothetical protein